MPNFPRFTFSVLLVDATSVFLAFNTVAILRGISSAQNPLLTPLLVPWVLLLVILALIDGYNPRTDYLSVDYSSQHLIAVFSATVGTLLFIYVFFNGSSALQQSRLVTILSFLLVAPASLIGRRILALRRTAFRRDHTVVFVGDEESAKSFTADCKANRLNRPVRRSWLESGHSRPAIADVLDEIEFKHLAVEAVVLRDSAEALPPGLPDRLMRLHLNGVPTYTLERFYEVIWKKIPLQHISPAWLFQGGFQLAREPVFDHLKRISDLFLAFALMVLSAPFLALAALAILIDDRGPVFFRQTRIGRHRQPFTLYKLRTMRVVQDGALYTTTGDKRITRVGGFLRASRLDELPQIWNVLRGDMSMIGPRAEWDKLVATYQEKIPCYHFRHLVRPGITGWAQINYPYGANLEDTIRKLEYDLYYIRHYSFMLDASIVLKTVHVMLFGKGAR